MRTRMRFFLVLFETFDPDMFVFFRRVRVVVIARRSVFVPNFPCQKGGSAVALGSKSESTRHHSAIHRLLSFGSEQKTPFANKACFWFSKT